MDLYILNTKFEAIAILDYYESLIWTERYYREGDFEIYKQLKELEQELAPFGFLRCHRKYMVNMRNISIMRSDYCFVLENSSRTEVPIGITYKDEAEKAYLSYVSEED